MFYFLSFFLEISKTIKAYHRNNNIPLFSPSIDVSLMFTITIILRSSFVISDHRCLGRFESGLHFVILPSISPDLLYILLSHLILILFMTPIILASLRKILHSSFILIYKSFFLVCFRPKNFFYDKKQVMLNAFLVHIVIPNHMDTFFGRPVHVFSSQRFSSDNVFDQWIGRIPSI